MRLELIGLPCLFVLVFAVAGCTALQPPRDEAPELHVLDAVPTARSAPARRDIVVEIGVPRARPGFETAQMAYVRAPFALDYYAKSRWADAPAHMLGPLVAQALEQSGGFRAVVRAPSTVPADVLVDTELVRLQQNFAVRPSRIELTLHAQLIDVRGRRILATRVLEEFEPAPSEDAKGGVIAANAALQRLLERLVDFCVVEFGAR